MQLGFFSLHWSSTLCDTDFQRKTKFTFIFAPLSNNGILFFLLNSDKTLLTLFLHQTDKTKQLQINWQLKLQVIGHGLDTSVCGNAPKLSNGLFHNPLEASAMLLAYELCSIIFFSSTKLSTNTFWYIMWTTSFFIIIFYLQDSFCGLPFLSRASVTACWTAEKSIAVDIAATCIISVQQILFLFFS